LSATLAFAAERRVVGQTGVTVGINVRTETEDGEKLSEWDDPRGLTKALLPASSDSTFSCLRFVDRFGDAVFNQLQIPVLISELRRQAEHVKDPGTRDHAEAILRLVEGAEGEVHTYVRFIGD
jgi:hypothetical protein